MQGGSELPETDVQVLLETVMARVRMDFFEPLQAQIDELSQRVTNLESNVKPQRRYRASERTNAAEHRTEPEAETTEEDEENNERGTTSQSPVAETTANTTSTGLLGRERTRERPARSGLLSARTSTRESRKSGGGYYARKKKRVTLRESTKLDISEDANDKASLAALEKRASQIRGTIDDLESRHQQTMQNLEAEEALVTSFWEEMSRSIVNTDTIEDILSNNVDINLVRSDGRQALDIAVDNENEELALFLRQHGGQFTATAKDVFTDAADQGNVNKMRLFMLCDFTLTQKEGGLAVLRCVRGNHLNGVEYLVNNDLADINVKDWVDGTPLMSAARIGDVNLVNFLLRANAQLDIKSRWGGTALTMALSSNNYDVVDILIDARADVNQKTKTGDTCLLLVLQQNNFLVDKMLTAGADVNQSNKTDITPLEFAVKNNDTDLCVSLLNYNADIDRQNTAHKTCLHLAIKQENMELVDLLLDHGALVNIADDEDNTALTLVSQLQQNDSNMARMERVLQAGCNVNHQNRIGFGAIHYACNKLDYDAIKILMQHGADKDLQSIAWGSPMDMATGKEDETLLDILDPPAERKRRERERKLNVGGRTSNLARKRAEEERKKEIARNKDKIAKTKGGKAKKKKKSNRRKIYD